MDTPSPSPVYRCILNNGSHHFFVRQTKANCVLAITHGVALFCVAQNQNVLGCRLKRRQLFYV